MKKTLSVLLIAGLLFSGTIAYAEESTTAKPDIKSRLAARMQNAKNWTSEVKPQAEEVRSNKAEIAHLKSESKIAYRAAKSKVKEFMKNKDSLTNEQIQALKQAISSLSNNKEQLDSTVGYVRAESLKLNAARKDRNLEAYKQALDEIIIVQNARMNVLKAVIDNMNKIAEM